MRLRFATLLCALIVAPAFAQDIAPTPTEPVAAPAPETQPAAPPEAAEANPPDGSAATPAATELPPEGEAGTLEPSPSGEIPAPGVMPAEVTQESPDGTSVADTAGTTATVATGEVRRVVVLQPEFRVFVQSAGGMREIEPGWTEQAQNALALAVERHLRHDPRFAVAAPVEPATAEEATLLREHVELFKVIASNSSMMIRFGGKAWQEKKLQYDYTLGDGLALYGDRSNADYAFMIGGAQVKQTGGSVFMQLALAGTLGVVMPGGGTYLMLALVDMRTGDIVWFNSLEGGEVFGMTGSDLRKEGTADEIIGRLFDPFPASSLFNTKIF